MWLNVNEYNDEILMRAHGDSIVLMRVHGDSIVDWLSSSVSYF